MKTILITSLITSLSLPCWSDEIKPLVFEIFPATQETEKSGEAVKVTIRNADPDQIKAITEAVTKALSKKKDKEEKKRTSPADLIETQRELVDKRRKELSELVKKFGIPYFEGDQANPLGITGQEMFRKAQEKLDQFQTQRDQIEIEVKKLMTIPDDQLIAYAAGLNLPENRVAQLTNQIQAIHTSRLKKTAQGLGKDHPEIVALHRRETELTANARKEVTSLKAVLKTKLELLNRQITRMDGMVKGMSKKSLTLSQKEQMYHDAKRKYEESKDTLQKMKLRQQELLLQKK